MAQPNGFCKAQGSGRRQSLLHAMEWKLNDSLNYDSRLKAAEALKWRKEVYWVELLSHCVCVIKQLCPTGN